MNIKIQYRDLSHGYSLFTHTFYVSGVKMACEKLLDVVSGLVPPAQMPTKVPDDMIRVKTKVRKGKRPAEQCSFTDSYH